MPGKSALVVAVIALILSSALDVAQGQPRSRDSGRPAADRLAFVRRDGIWIGRTDGTQLRRAYALPTGLYEMGGPASGKARITAPPAWSPDGTRLCFGDNQSERLLVINLQGAVLQRIAPLPFDPEQRKFHQEHPSDWNYVQFQQLFWPRSEFILSRYGASDYLSRVLAWNGRKPRQFDSSKHPIDGIDVSRDGKWASYTETDPDEWGSALYLADLRTGKRKRLYHSRQRSIGGPSLAPDAKQICVLMGKRLRVDEVAPPSRQDGAWIIDVNGKLRQLGRSGDLAKAAWSPDGRWIAFEHVGDAAGTYLYDFRTRNFKLLTKRHGFTLSWTPDRRSVMVDEGPEGLWRVPVPGGQAKKIVADGYFPAVFPAR